MFQAWHSQPGNGLPQINDGQATQAVCVSPQATSSYPQQGLAVMRQMVVHKGDDKVVAVVIARVAAQGKGRAHR